MKVKLEWLQELVDLEGISLTELVNKLSTYSIEVETVDKLVEATNLVVGYVVDCKKHENSDHLSVCLVDVGKEALQIVCGAPNVKSGQKVIVALPDATLPGGIKIKKTKLRGVESNGMICSLSELGIEKKYIEEEYQNGIYYFKDDVEVGMDALKALNLADYTISLGLTPNRGDLLSMLGVAIEVSAILNRPLKPLALETINEEIKGELDVKVETDKCLGYFGRLIKDVVVKPSPRWLISRLIAFGIRPINNCVDITNYILALFGQPLHAFDYAKLGQNILVRMALDGEEIVTLDNEKRTLTKDDIVITDGKKPVAIAGVMGGLDSEVTETTKDIVLEAAVFDGVSIRNTSQRLGLKSDSSIRFEKGVDLNSTKLALDYATYLFKKYANGKVSITKYSGLEKINPKVIKITEEDVEKKLGINVSKDDIKNILERLQFKVTSDLEVIVSSRRFDINIKEDLIEEIGRIYGYEKLPLTLHKTISVGGLSPTQILRRQIINTLVGLGLNENITYSLVSEKDNELFKLIHEANTENVNVLMPLSQDHKTLRKAILPSLIECIKYAYNRKLENIAIFEIGKVYYKNENYQEEEHLAIAVSNDYTKSLNHHIKADFYLLKGIVEELFNTLKMEVTFVPLTEKCAELHPGRSAMIYLNNQYIGFLGEIHPKFAKENDLDDVYVCEIKLSPIYNYQRKEFKFNPIPKVPSVERDIAIVVDRSILASDIVNAIKEVKNTNIKEVNIFDVYTGEKIANDKKSIAINLVFETFETLTDEVINDKVNKILNYLNKKFNAELRA